VIHRDGEKILRFGGTFEIPKDIGGRHLLKTFDPRGGVFNAQESVIPDNHPPFPKREG